MSENIINLTCIGCPNGCRIQVKKLPDGELDISGYECARGKTYAKAEVTNPVRTVTASARVKGGEWPLVSVKTNAPVPKSSIPDVLRAITLVEAEAPLKIGDVLISDVCGTGADVVCTRNV